MTLTNLQRDRGMCISFFEPAGVASTSLKISVLYVAKLNLLNGAVDEKGYVQDPCLPLSQKSRMEQSQRHDATSYFQPILPLFVCVHQSQ